MKLTTIVCGDDLWNALLHIIQNLRPNSGGFFVSEEVHLDPAAVVVYEDHEVAVGAIVSSISHIATEVLQVDYDSLTKSSAHNRMNMLTSSDGLRLAAVSTL